MEESKAKPRQVGFSSRFSRGFWSMFVEYILLFLSPIAVLVVATVAVLLSFSKFQNQVIMGFMENVMRFIQWSIDDNVGRYIENAEEVRLVYDSDNFDTKLVIRDPEGRIRTVSLREVWDAMSMVLQSTFSGYVFFRGELVAAHPPEKFFESLSSGTVKFSGFPEFEKLLKSEAIQSFAKLTKDYVYLVSRDASGQFVILLAYHRGRFMSFFKKNMNQMKKVLLASVFLSLLIALFLSLKEAAFLRKFSEAVKTLSEGNLEVRIDVGKVRKSYRALAESFNRMAEKLSEFTQKLVESEVEKAKLNERHRTFRHVTASLVHDLKNPISVVISALESYARNNSKDYLKLAEVASKMSLEMVQNFLFAAKLEDSEFYEEPVRVELVSFLRDIVNQFKPIFEVEEVALIFDSEVDSLEMELPVTLFYRAISNLLMNSLRYSRSGGKVVVGVRRESRPSEGSYREGFYVFVRDEGVGIPKEELEKIFEPFFTGKGGQTGLGLFVVKRVASLYGWDVKVESEPGKGTEFRIYLR